VGAKIKAQTTIRLRLSSEKHLKTLLEAVSPETKEPRGQRARAFLEREDQFLVLKMEANDTIALRASLNAYLRWIDSTVRVLETLECTSQII